MAHSSLFNHVKLKRLASRLSVSRPTALGHLAYLWNYAGDCRMDGSLTGLPDEDIELAAEWEGEAGAFVEACIGAGFIDRDGDGTWIHDWDDWCPDYVRKRLSRRKDKGLRSKTADNGSRAADNGSQCLPNGGQRLPGPGRAEPSRENTPQPPLPQATESTPPDDAIGETHRDIPADPGPADPLEVAFLKICGEGRGPANATNGWQRTQLEFCVKKHGYKRTLAAFEYVAEVGETFGVALGYAQEKTWSAAKAAAKAAPRGNGQNPELATGAF